jgi:hypothetical protein
MRQKKSRNELFLERGALESDIAEMKSQLKKSSPGHGSPGDRRSWGFSGGHIRGPNCHELLYGATN